MRAEEHRALRLGLGAYALGHLPPAECPTLEGHLAECAECRAELSELKTAGQLLALADPDRVAQPAPRPPAELAERVAAAVAAERRQGQRKRRGLRVGFALAGATAAAALALALVLLLGGSETGSRGPVQQVEFGSLPGGVQISATLAPHSFGTEIHMYVKGVRSGTLCRVFLRDRRGRSFSAGSFRYRWGEDSEAVLSSALDLSRTGSIGVHAGGRTFVAPLAQGAGPVTWNPTKEDA